MRSAQGKCRWPFFVATLLLVNRWPPVFAENQHVLFGCLQTLHLTWNKSSSLAVAGFAELPLLGRVVFWLQGGIILAHVSHGDCWPQVLNTPVTPSRGKQFLISISETPWNTLCFKSAVEGAVWINPESSKSSKHTKLRSAKWLSQYWMICSGHLCSGGKSQGSAI